MPAEPTTEPGDAEIQAIVRAMRVVAVLGMKDDARAGEPAVEIPRMLVERGVEVIPVNPTIERSLGRRAYRSDRRRRRAVRRTRCVSPSGSHAGDCRTKCWRYRRSGGRAWSGCRAGSAMTQRRRGCARQGLPWCQDACLG